MATGTGHPLHQHQRPIKKTHINNQGVKSEGGESKNKSDNSIDSTISPEKEKTFRKMTPTPRGGKKTEMEGEGELPQTHLIPHMSKDCTPQGNPGNVWVQHG